MDAIELVMDAERRLHSPAVRADPAALGALLAPEFELFGSSGLLWTRREVIDAGASIDALLPREMVGMRVLELAPDVYLVTYLAASPERRARRASIWRLTPGGPQAVLHQGTPVS